VQVQLAPKEQVIEFLQQTPAVMYDLLQRMYSGVDGLLLRTRYFMSGSAHNRLITTLLICAKRFGSSPVNSNSVELTITEKELAAQSGLARETISREIKILKEKNLVSLQKNKLRITDLHQLEQEISPSS